MKRKAIIIFSIMFLIGVTMVCDVVAQKTQAQYLGVFHTGITVKNLDDSIPFYRDVLGFKIAVGPTDWFGGPTDTTLCASLGVVCPAELRLVVFEVPGGGKATLELLEYRSPASDPGAPFPANTWGAHHVAFRVKDIDAMIERLEDEGVTFFPGPNDNPSGPLAGWRWIYFIDPTNFNAATGRGIILEFIEIDPRIIER